LQSKTIKNNNLKTITIMRTKDLKKLIDGLDKWQVNRLLDDNSNKIGDSGYYPSYTIITLNKKKAVVNWDDRDAIVHVVTEFYDDIKYSGRMWDGDHRWNNDKPIVVVKKGLCNLNEVHGSKLLMKEWVSYIDPCSEWDSENRYTYFKGYDKDGKPIRISLNGEILSDIHPERMKEVVMSYTTEEIISNWIDKNKPCGHIRGLEYKGAKVRSISSDDAKEYIKSHHTFKGQFNNAEWMVVNGVLTLVFRDYCDSDYD
jgi:hypothetical protein